eukprot:5320234-Pyramimonas_sp.AAC.1
MPAFSKRLLQEAGMSERSMYDVLDISMKEIVNGYGMVPLSAMILPAGHPALRQQEEDQDQEVEEDQPQMSQGEPPEAALRPHEEDQDQESQGGPLEKDKGAEEEPARLLAKQIEALDELAPSP